MIIYCDIDFTIADAWPRIKRWTLPQWPGDKIDPRAFTDEEIMKDEPIDGAVNALNKLALKNEIFYLTARGWKGAFKITQKWLIKYNFPYPYGIYTVERMIDKIKFFIDRECDLYIDDFTTSGNLKEPIFQKDVVPMIESFGIKVEVFKNNWKEIVEKYGN